MAGRVLSCKHCASTRIDSAISPPVKDWERSDDAASFIARHVFIRKCLDCRRSWTEDIARASALSRISTTDGALPTVAG